MMLGIDGYEGEKLKADEKTKEIPVIFVTVFIHTISGRAIV